MDVIDPGDARERRCDRGDHRGSRRVSVKQVVAVLTDQIANAQGGAEVDSTAHRSRESSPPDPLVLLQQFGEFSRLDADKIGSHAELWQTSTEMRLNPLGTREMLAIDDVQHLDVGWSKDLFGTDHSLT